MYVFDEDQLIHMSVSEIYLGRGNVRRKRPTSERWASFISSWHLIFDYKPLDGQYKKADQDPLLKNHSLPVKSD